MSVLENKKGFFSFLKSTNYNLKQLKTKKPLKSKKLLKDKSKKGYKGFQIQHEKEPHKFVTDFKNECKKLH